MNDRTVPVTSYVKYLRKKKEKQNDYFFIIFFHLESGDLERLFGTKKMLISKIQKLETYKFNKHLFLKNLFEIRSSLREIFFEKMLLEFDKSFNVIVMEFMFSGAGNGGVL